MSSTHERVAGVEGIESLSTNTCNRGTKARLRQAKNSKLKIWRENSLFRAEFSLIRVQKSPVPLRREFAGSH
jgi:hypothetical protein